MALTPNSSPTSYASPAEFQQYKDYRLYGQLVKDDKTQQTATGLLTDANMIKALNAASGQVEAACLIGKRYGTADLAAMNGVSQDYLKFIVCALAARKLWSRRDGGDIPKTLIEDYEEAKQALKDLRDGEQIFAFAEVEQAGLPDDNFETSAQIINRNMATTAWQRTLGIRQGFRRNPGIAGFF